MKSKTCGITIHCGGNTRQQRCNVRMFMCTTRPTSSYEVKKPLDNLCLPLLRLGITLRLQFLHLQGLSWHSGLWHWLLQLWSWHVVVFHLHDLIQQGHSFFQQSLWICLLLEQIIRLSSFSFLFASIFLCFSFQLFFLLPFFIVSMRRADAVHYISREGQALRFTTILGDVGWNRTQAIDGWHFQPRSVACQQQLVLAKSSLYICTAMVKCECNPCQFH